MVYDYQAGSALMNQAPDPIVYRYDSPARREKHRREMVMMVAMSPICALVALTSTGAIAFLLPFIAMISLIWDRVRLEREKVELYQGAVAIYPAIGRTQVVAYDDIAGVQLG